MKRDQLSVRALVKNISIITFQPWEISWIIDYNNLFDSHCFSERSIINEPGKITQKNFKIVKYKATDLSFSSDTDSFINTFSLSFSHSTYTKVLIAKQKVEIFEAPPPYMQKRKHKTETSGSCDLQIDIESDH